MATAPAGVWDMAMAMARVGALAEADGPGAAAEAAVLAAVEAGEASAEASAEVSAEDTAPVIFGVTREIIKKGLI